MSCAPSELTVTRCVIFTFDENNECGNIVSIMFVYYHNYIIGKQLYFLTVVYLCDDWLINDCLFVITLCAMLCT